jgi:hypothetical protein
VAIELDVRALAVHRLGREVGEHQARIPAVGQPDVLRGKDGQGEVSVPPDELVGLRVAVREGRLHERPSQEADLAGGVSVLLVEVPDQAARAPGLAGSDLNICRMKL